MVHVNKMVLALSLLALLPSACSYSVSSEEFGPAGILSRLQAFEPTDDAVIEVAAPDRYRFLFDPGGTLVAPADCNTCSGEYGLAGGLFRMGVSGCTRAACPPDSLETKYVTALSAVTAFSFSGSELTLTYLQGVMRFSSD
jgi:heat shock protein HslJ